MDALYATQRAYVDGLVAPVLGVEPWPTLALVVAAVVPMLATEGFDEPPHALARKTIPVIPVIPVTSAMRVVLFIRRYTFAWLLRSLRQTRDGSLQEIFVMRYPTLGRVSMGG